jgi:tetratricopeptide (TPR) repeat protein
LLFAAKSAYQKEEYDLAIEHCQRLLRERSKSEVAVDAYFYVGECFFAKKDYLKAIEIYKEFTQTFKGSYLEVDAYERWGDCLYLMGQYQEALERFERSLEVEKNARLVYKLAKSLKRMKRLEEAVDHFTKVFYEYPNEVQWVEKALFEAAECHEDLGRYGEAKILYEKIVELGSSGVEKALRRIRHVNEILNQEGSGAMRKSA